MSPHRRLHQQKSQSLSQPYLLYLQKEQAEPDVVEDETTSVLAVKTSDSESDTFIIQPSASLPEQPAEPTLFAPPAESTIKETQDAEALTLDSPDNSSDEFPLVLGPATQPTSDTVDALEAQAPIVTPESEGLEFQITSDDGTTLATQSPVISEPVQPVLTQLRK